MVRKFTYITNNVDILLVNDDAMTDYSDYYTSVLKMQKLLMESGILTCHDK